MNITLPSGSQLRFAIHHDSKKRKTTAQILKPTGDQLQVIASSTARCFGGNATTPPDQFVRKEGLRRAMTEAMTEAKLSREDRTAAWRTIWNGLSERTVAKSLKPGDRIVLPETSVYPARKAKVVSVTPSDYGTTTVGVELEDGSITKPIVASSFVFQKLPKSK